MKLIVLFFFVCFFALAQDESSLLQECKQSKLEACEKLAANYMNKRQWDKAYLVGEMLCGKDVLMGCTFAGSSKLALKQPKEGIEFLNKACDKFEPYACRSLGRLYKNNGEKALSHVYFKRACHYGLDEMCKQLKKSKDLSKEGAAFLKKVHSNCEDVNHSLCQDQMALLNRCEKPLTKEDCLLLPGELSIYFRARLIQSEAKLSLMALLASEKTFKETQRPKAFSYNLQAVLKNFKPLEKYHYVFGFMKACRKKYGQKEWIAHSLDLYSEAYAHLGSTSLKALDDFFAQGKQGDCYDPGGGFSAYAVGILDPLSAKKLDVWKINQDGNVIQVKDGLP